MITVLYLYFSAGTSWYCHVLPVDASSISQLNKCPKSFTAISVVFLTSFNSDLFWGITQVYREFLKWVIPSRHHRFQYKVMVIHGGWCGATPMKHLGNRARYFLSHGVGTPSYIHIQSMFQVIDLPAIGNPSWPMTYETSTSQAGLCSSGSA